MANNIVTAKVKIRGVRPLMWHVFGPDALPLEKQEKTGVAGNDPEEWRKTYTATKTGQLYMPGTYAFATIIDGAKYTKKGKGSIQKLVAATLQIIEDKLLVNRKIPVDMGDNPEKYYNADGEPVYIDIRGVRNPSTRSRNIRYRVTASPGRETEFTVMFDKTIVSRVEIQACLRDAGVLSGIADGRAMGMGRFEVVSYQELDDAKEKTA